MKILVVSNLYPPHYMGGYELGCKDVVESLRARGHAVSVLTSRYGVPSPRREGDVHRLLRSDWDRRSQRPVALIESALRRELANRRAFLRLVTEVQPDLVYFWNLAGTSYSLVGLANRLGLATHCYVSEGWLGRLPAGDAWFGLVLSRTGTPVRRLALNVLRALGRLLGLPLDASKVSFTSLQFTSEYLRTAAAAALPPASRTAVIHWGIDGESFPFRAETRPFTGRLLYVGRVSPEKGVHTAVEALHHVRAGGLTGATLDVVGGCQSAEYMHLLEAKVRDLDLGGVVRFLGKVDRAGIPEILRLHDALVFPSVWDEPFSIGLLEAMSSGLPVVATGTGGTPEILRHGVNGLEFPAQDARACAREVLRMAAEPALADRLRRAARATVEREFQFRRMVDRLAEDLEAPIVTVSDSSFMLRKRAAAAAISGRACGSGEAHG